MVHVTGDIGYHLFRAQRDKIRGLFTVTCYSFKWLGRSIAAEKEANTTGIWRVQLIIYS